MKSARSLVFVNPTNAAVTTAALGILLLFSVSASAYEQGQQTLFGDIRIFSKSGSVPDESVTVVLYGVSQGSGELCRQTVSNRGRYRFSNLKNGEYEIAVEFEGNEIGRLRNVVLGPLSNSPYGFQFDLEFEWKPSAARTAVGTVSATEVYKRSTVNQSLFKKAEEAAARKSYDGAAAYLEQILEDDKDDFQAWAILGTIYLLQDKAGNSEKAYLTALEIQPRYSLALLNLGRVRNIQKKFEEAIEPLTLAVETNSQSAEANLLLGEAYLQVKKGSRAIPHLEEAARLGRHEAHLRLGWLYNAAGLKELAAAEYEQFLKKNPDYADRRKMEDYISANRRQ